MTKTTTNPLALARLITAMAEEIDALHWNFTDYAVALEELKETNEGVKRFDYADTHADRAMACLRDAERHMKEIANLLQH
jgi:hypothetical protein